MADLWHWPPNTLEESLEFATDIRRSRTAEKRDSYKDATQRLTMSHVVRPDVAEAMMDLHRKSPTTEIDVPEWTVATFHRGLTLSASDTIIPVEDSVAYQIGQGVFIGAEGGAYERGTVASVGASNITLTTGITATYNSSQSSPVAVAPIVTCILPAGVEIEKRFPIRTVNVNFLSLTPIDIGLNTYPEFQSIPYLTNGLIPKPTLNGRVSQAMSLLNSGFGAYALAAVEDYSRLYGEVSFVGDSYADRFSQRRFLHFMRGRDGEMWVPSGQRDIVLNAGFTTSTTTIDVVPTLPAARMIGRRISLRQGDQFSAHEVTAASDASLDQQFLTIGNPSFTGDALSQVSFLNKCRFDSDEFSISYEYRPSGLFSRFSAPIIEVP